MTQTIAMAGARQDTEGGIRWHYLWAAAASVAVLIAAVNMDNFWFLNFVHVLFGLLWTGYDLIMGFVIGPIIRKLDLAARRAMILRMIPRTIFLPPTVAAITITSGWYLTVARGYMDLPAPAIWWVWAALVIAVILTIQGVGLLLPTTIRVYLTMRTAEPDIDKVARLMRNYVWIVASQGIFQITIIIIMAKFVTGL